MTKPRTVVIGAELANEALRTVVDRALGFPMKAMRVGRGPWVVSPDTWDGSGATPPGWTRTAVDLHVGAVDSALEIPDAFVTALQSPQAQSRLSVADRATLTAAIATRATIDLPASGYAPKPNAADVAAAESKEK